MFLSFLCQKWVEGVFNYDNGSEFCKHNYTIGE
jgi:hypothetical protein